MQTIGLSPKAVLAFFFPLIAAAITAATSALATGHFDTTQIVIAATGLGTSAVALLGAYVGQPGELAVVADDLSGEKDVLAAREKIS
jgi:hypothetical protein